MTAEQTQREKILQRILNLRAKTDDAGASESEMQTAFTIAMKLMDSYNVEEAELALAENTGRIVLDITQKTSDASVLINRHRHKIMTCLCAIARFTNCQVVMSLVSGDITYTGHRPDTELANYLTTVCRQALDNEYDKYRCDHPRVGYGAKSSFQIMMARRISSRLNDMKNEQEANQKEEYRKAKLQLEHKDFDESGTEKLRMLDSHRSLIVQELAEQKREAVGAFFAKKYPKLRSVGGFSGGRNSSAHNAGRAAGDRVHLGQAIAAGSTKMIGN